MGIEKCIESAPETNTLVGMKFGCLQVLDDGAEHLWAKTEKIDSIKAEKNEFIKAIKTNRLKHSNWVALERNVPLEYAYTPKTFQPLHDDSVSVCDFDKAISKLENEAKHYKCVCKKCGKVRHYSKETLQTKPKFCYSPIYCASKLTCTFSEKKDKYKNNESICLTDELKPKAEYCDSWNEKRKKDLIKQAEKEAEIIAAVPRKYAQNYDTNFVGLRYESYEVIECINEAYEDAPVPYYNQHHQKKYHDITIYKRYRCKCYLCGKERLVNCDQFGIYPPTQYGCRAYNGYWSEIYCDCHRISSFQWIVNDILLKNNVEYQVEVSVDGVYGIDNETPLRFDFAIYKKGKLVAFLECQGEQHYKSVEKFGGEYRFAVQQRNDEVKRQYTRDHNIELIEISYKEKKYEKIKAILKKNNVIN